MRGSRKGARAIQVNNFENLKTVKAQIEEKREQAEICIGTTDDGEYFLSVGNERISISDYKIQSSATGEAELCVTIQGLPGTVGIMTNLVNDYYTFTKLSASSTEQM